MIHLATDFRRACRLTWVGLRISAKLLVHTLLKRPNIRQKRAELTREGLEDLGLTFVKVGQFMALRFDLLSREMADELQKLFDRVRALDIATVRDVIEGELGRPLVEIFADFNVEPIAAASVAQVHEARLRTGERVAVKVQRPGIQRVFETDCRLLLVMARFIDLVNPSSPTKQTRMVLEFRSWALNEVNFQREGRLADQFRRNALPFEIIPRVFWAFTTRKVLVLEFIEGTSLSKLRDWLHEGGLELIQQRIPELNVRLAMSRLAHALLNQLFVTGLFHGDPHPGNMIVQHDGGIAFVDFGIVGEASPIQRALLRKHYMEFAMGNIDASVDAYAKLWRTTEETDLPAFKRDIKSALVRWHELLNKKDSVNIEEMHWGEYAQESSMAVMKHGLKMSTDLLLFYRTVGILHASLLMMEVNMIAEMEIFFRETANDPIASGWSAGTESQTRALEHNARMAPSRLTTLLSRMASQEYHLPIQAHESDAARQTANALTRACATAILGLSAAVLASGPSAGATASATLTGISAVLFALALAETRKA